MDNGRRSPMDFGSWSQRSRLNLALYIKPCGQDKDYSYIPITFKPHNLSCRWYEEEPYWFWVMRSKSNLPPSKGMPRFALSLLDYAIPCVANNFEDSWFLSSPIWARVTFLCTCFTSITWSEVWGIWNSKNLQKVFWYTACLLLDAVTWCNYQ